MKCLFPQIIEKKNILGLTRGGMYPCGKCINCLKDRKRDWAFRLDWECKRAVTADFICLTYAPEHVPVKGNYLTLDKSHLATFHKSLKRAQDRYFTDELGAEAPDIRLKYYAVGEYGTDGMRPHYHSILFNLHPEMKNRITALWGKGHVHFGEVNRKSIRYATKYLIDSDWRADDKGIQRPFAMMSKNLGENYLHSNHGYHKTLDDQPEDWRFIVIDEKGRKQRLPRYYRDKIFSPEESQYIGQLHRDKETDQWAEDFQKIWDQDRTQTVEQVFTKMVKNKKRKAELSKQQSKKLNTL